MPNLGLDLQRSQVHGDSITPQDRTTTLNGNSVDFQEAEGPVTAVMVLGTVTATGTFTVHIQESTDDSTFTNMSATTDNWTDGGGNTQASFGGTDDNDSYLFSGFNRGARYCRAVMTWTGTGAAANIAVALMSKNKSY